jgi:hypothetical protein
LIRFPLSTTPATEVAASLYGGSFVDQLDDASSQARACNASAQEIESSVFILQQGFAGPLDGCDLATSEELIALLEDLPDVQLLFEPSQVLTALVAASFTNSSRSRPI